MAALLSFFGSRLGLGLLAAIALATMGWTTYRAVYSSGVDACERRYAQARNEAIAQDHASYYAAVEWGNTLSTQLATAQRRNDQLKTEYLTYAHAIAGHCPSDLGVLVNAAATGENLSYSASSSIEPTTTITAAAIAGNIAENYGRANACLTQLNALITWHEGQLR